MTGMGKSKSTRIYEVYSGDIEEVIEKKDALLPAFKEALKLFQQKNWSDAITSFTECLHIYPHDRVSQIYLGRSIEFKLDPPKDDWDGSTHMMVK